MLAIALSTVFFVCSFLREPLPSPDAVPADSLRSRAEELHPHCYGYQRRRRIQSRSKPEHNRNFDRAVGENT
jgi:hypothetical protein